MDTRPEKTPPIMVPTERDCACEGNPSAEHQRRQEKKASGETAVTAAAVAAKDHVPQGQNSKQAQHCFNPPFLYFNVPVIS